MVTVRTSQNVWACGVFAGRLPRVCGARLSNSALGLPACSRLRVTLSLGDLRMVPAQGNNPNDSKGSGHSHGDCQHGVDIGTKLTQNCDPDGDSDNGVDHSQPCDHQIRRPARIGALHEPGAEPAGSGNGDHGVPLHVEQKVPVGVQQVPPMMRVRTATNPNNTPAPRM